MQTLWIFNHPDKVFAVSGKLLFLLLTKWLQGKFFSNQTKSPKFLNSFIASLNPYPQYSTVYYNTFTMKNVADICVISKSNKGCFLE